jgi:hypothetical protein
MDWLGGEGDALRDALRGSGGIAGYAHGSGRYRSGGSAVGMDSCACGRTAVGSACRLNHPTCATAAWATDMRNSRAGAAFLLLRPEPLASSYFIRGRNRWLPRRAARGHLEQAQGLVVAALLVGLARGGEGGAQVGDARVLLAQLLLLPLLLQRQAKPLLRGRKVSLVAQGLRQAEVRSDVARINGDGLAAVGNGFVLSP